MNTSIKYKIIIPVFCIMVLSTIISSGITIYKNYINEEQNIIYTSKVSLSPIILSSNVAISGANLMKLRSKYNKSLFESTNALYIKIEGMSDEIKKSLFSAAQASRKVSHVFQQKNAHMDENLIEQYQDLDSIAIIKDDHLFIKEKLNIKNGGTLIAIFDARRVSEIFVDTIISTVVVSLPILFISLGFLYWIIDLILRDLTQFRNGLIDFFKYLNKEQKDIKLITVKSKDEIGMMSKVINEKIVLAKRIIDEDIIKRSDELEKLANSLEVEVASKTKELLHLNSSLEDRIKHAIEDNRKKDELLYQQSKLAAMGEMMGNIAHQWRQPLNALAGNIQMVDMDYEDHLIDEAYTKQFIIDNMSLIHFMSKTIDDFRSFFNSDKLKTDFKILSCLDKPINILKPQLKECDIDLKVDGVDFTIHDKQSELQQVILNIINNARDALVENKTEHALIHIKTSVENDVGILIIEDNAGGIPTAVINRVFEPYYTTKEQGKGTGIGLYMSKTIIVDNMKGTLSVTNTKVGACFKITLGLAKL
ncbi:MAG: GHKL domain-containing protein [Campylobacteraceae bacterium]|nr:GHKL domain-containing protein [Campylobacteraceae bacterium]